MAKKTEQRTMERLRYHYEIEKELANKLRIAPKNERKNLYSSLYNELFRRVPDHPQLTNKSLPEERMLRVIWQKKYIQRFLKKDTIFMEIGAGDCSLSLELAKKVKQVYAVDVSEEITKGLDGPENFQLIISDGLIIPVPQNTIDVAYSNQLMEHLHPEDAFEHLQNIFNTLTPGGVYICFTPNKTTGPHDISGFFEREATGFHLKEYTISELGKLFKKAGFSKTKILAEIKSTYTNVPLFVAILFEKLLLVIPYSYRKLISRKSPFKLFLGIRMIGIK